MIETTMHSGSDDTATPITELLAAHAEGRDGALDELFRLVYAELLVVARAQRRRLRAGGTLDTTALVHDCYIRLSKGAGLTARDRGHFYATVAQAMRHVLVDYARTRGRAKRSGDHVTADEHIPGIDSQVETVLAVHQALERLALIDERLVRVAECRYFAGLSVAETAEALGVSTATIERTWRAVRGFLGEQLAP